MVYNTHIRSKVVLFRAYATSTRRCVLEAAKIFSEECESTSLQADVARMERQARSYYRMLGIELQTLYQIEWITRQVQIPDGLRERFREWQIAFAHDSDIPI